MIHAHPPPTHTHVHAVSMSTNVIAISEMATGKLPASINISRYAHTKHARS